MRIISPRIEEGLLREMSALLSPADCAEMAIPSYLHRNPLMRSMAWWRVGLLAQELARSSGGKSRSSLRIMDFGCGAGVLFEDASKVAADVIGVDIVLDAAKLLVERRGLGEVRLMTPSEAEVQIEPGTVDIVLAGEVLEHVEPLRPTIDWLGRCLRPQGELLVTLPTESAFYRLGRRLAGFSGHYHHANAASIGIDLQRAGFSLRHKSQIPLPGPMSIYWCMRFTPPSHARM